MIKKKKNKSEDTTKTSKIRVIIIKSYSVKILKARRILLPTCDWNITKII